MQEARLPTAAPILRPIKIPATVTTKALTAIAGEDRSDSLPFLDYTVPLRLSLPQDVQSQGLDHHDMSSPGAPLYHLQAVVD